MIRPRNTLGFVSHRKNLLSLAINRKENDWGAGIATDMDILLFVAIN
jgi:hypothetical protein